MLCSYSVSFYSEKCELGYGWEKTWFLPAQEVWAEKVRVEVMPNSGGVHSTAVAAATEMCCFFRSTYLQRLQMVVSSILGLTSCKYVNKHSTLVVCVILCQKLVHVGVAIGVKSRNNCSKCWSIVANGVVQMSMPSSFTTTTTGHLLCSEAISGVCAQLHIQL